MTDYGEDILTISFITLGVTHKCSTYGLASNRIERLELIKKLSESGMSNKGIAQYLNDRNLKTPNGKTYYGNLIWATLQKYNKRISRFQKADEIVRIREWAHFKVWIQ